MGRSGPKIKVVQKFPKKCGVILDMYFWCFDHLKLTKPIFWASFRCLNIYIYFHTFFTFLSFNPYIVPEPSPGRLFHMLLTRQVSDSLRPVPNDPKPILRCSRAKLLWFLAVLRDLDRSGMFKWGKLKCQKQSLQRPTISAETESLQEMVGTR